ncbi:MAG: Tad domain-containing protein [Candidatus Nanopelagicales bacterium]
MRVQLSPRRDDHGAVAVLVAVLAVVIIGIAAFVTDFGMAYAQRSALSTGADSAALAIVRQEQIKVIKNPTLTCAQLVANDAAGAPALALAQMNSNSPFGITLTASQLSVSMTCTGASGNPNGILQATVTVTKDVQTVLGGVVGVGKLSVNRTAVAALGAVNSASGYIPLTLCTDVVQKIVADGAADAAASPPVSRHVLVDLTKVWNNGNPCGGANSGSGNWGWLYCSSNGASDLATTITKGCPNPLTLNPGTPPSFTMDGTPGDKGNSNNVDTAMASRLDETVVLPVYDTLGGNGANTTYRVVGFLSAKLCAYNPNNKPQTGDCYLSGIDPVSGLNVTLTKNSIQLVYAGYTSAGDFSSLCGLGTVTCTFGTTKTALVQ